jgi:hypothetical protein
MIEPLLGAAAALAIGAGFIVTSQAVAWRFCRGGGTLTRWLTALSVLVWLANALFHLLIPAGFFARLPALASLGVLAGVAWIGSARNGPPMPWARRDRIFARRLITALHRSRYRLIVAAFVLCALPPLLRTLILPPLGWDALTYHSVKSALWVQHGTLAAMEAPGPWAYYRHMPGAAEVLTAWAMLASSSDAFAPGLEIAQWLALGLATMMLAREIGVREPFASTAAGFVMAIPTVRLLLGSGYVELCLLFTFVAGLALCLASARRGRARLLIAAGGVLGVSAATKLPMIAVTGLPLLIAVARAWFRGTRYERTCAAAAVLAYAVAVVPWLIAATIETGAPFSPVPIQVGGISLGRVPSELTWYLDRPVVSGLVRELPQLRRLFAPPGQNTEALGLLAAVPLAGMIAGWIPLLRRRRFAAALLASAAIASCGLYLSPGFAVIRQHWTENSSRFLLPAIAIAVVVSVAWCDRRRQSAWLYAALLMICALWNLAVFAFVGFSAVSRYAAIVTGAGLSVAAVLWLVIGRMPRHPSRNGSSPGVGLTVCLRVCLAVAAAAGLQVYRDRLRPELLQHDFALHRFASWNYWAGAVAVVDDPAVHRRIAVTSGPWQNLDNWFVYPFMGRRLQNDVVYVPIAGDGRIRHFGLDGLNQELSTTASAWAWQLRLREQHITEVVSFRPASIELAWMEANPDGFERLAGSPADWGVFRLR